MNFMKILVLIVALSGFLAHTTAIRTPQARVWSICKPTTVPLLCYKTVLPQVGPKFNMYKVLDIEVRETQKQVLKTVAKMASLALTHGFSKNLADALFTCKDQYSMIVDNVAQTVKLVAQRNAVEARYQFSAVISYNSACQDQFVNIASPLAADAEAVYNLTANCLDIMKAIEDRDARRSVKKN